MRTIRGWAAGIAILLASLGATGVNAKQIYLDEIIRMNAAGVLDEIIMSEVIATDSVFELSPDDIVRLSEAGLSDELIKFLIDTSRQPQAFQAESKERAVPDYEDDDLASTGNSEDDHLANTRVTDTPGTPITLDDVIWMNASGVLDEIIMSEVVATKSVFVLSPKDIIRLSEAGISDALIQFLMETGEHPTDSSTLETEVAVPEYYEDDDTDVYLGFGFNYGYYGGWYDPWYCSYSPYFAFHWGYGYPGWYYTPYCWSSYYPYGGYGCGYGYAPYCGYGWSGYSGNCFNSGGYPAGVYGLSTEKWKTNGGGASAQVAYSKAPRVADYSPALASLERTAPGEKLSVLDYAKVDTRSLDERVRPTRNARPTRSVKAPRANDGAVKYAEVAPDRIRQPANGSRPTKVTKSATDSNGRVSRSKAIEPGGKGAKPKSTVVRPSTKGSGKSSSPVYRSARAARTPSGGKSPAVRSAPTGRSSQVVRSAPTRSGTPTRSMSTGRSAPSYRSAPMRSSYGGGGGRSYGGGYGGGRSYGGGGGGRAGGGGKGR